MGGGVRRPWEDSRNKYWGTRNPVLNKVEGGDQHLKFSFDLHWYTMAYTSPQSYTETCSHTHTHRRERRREGGERERKGEILAWGLYSVAWERVKDFRWQTFYSINQGSNSKQSVLIICWDLFVRIEGYVSNGWTNANYKQRSPS